MRILIVILSCLLTAAAYTSGKPFPYEMTYESDSDLGACVRQSLAYLDAICKENGEHLDRTVGLMSDTFPEFKWTSEYVEDISEFLYGHLLSSVSKKINTFPVALIPCVQLNQGNGEWSTLSCFSIFAAYLGIKSHQLDVKLSEGIMERFCSLIPSRGYSKVYEISLMSVQSCHMKLGIKRSELFAFHHDMSFQAYLYKCLTFLGKCTEAVPENNRGYFWKSLKEDFQSTLQHVSKIAVITKAALQADKDYAFLCIGSIPGRRAWMNYWLRQRANMFQQIVSAMSCINRRLIRDLLSIGWRKCDMKRLLAMGRFISIENPCVIPDRSLVYASKSSLMFAMSPTVCFGLHHIPLDHQVEFAEDVYSDVFQCLNEFYQMAQRVRVPIISPADLPAKIRTLKQWDQANSIIRHLVNMSVKNVLLSFNMRDQGLFKAINLQKRLRALAGTFLTYLRFIFNSLKSTKPLEIEREVLEAEFLQAEKFALKAMILGNSVAVKVKGLILNKKKRPSLQ